MATFDELEAEVGKLRRKVRQLEGGNVNANNLRAVDDIVSEADGDERLIASGGSGGFSAACTQSHQSLIEKQKLAAQRELRNNPGCIKTPTALHSFRRSYSAVPTNDLDNIIREYSA